MIEFPADRHAMVEGWSVVEAVGPDAGNFLQSFCTNDVLRLEADQSCEAMFTDVKARVLAYGWVWRQNDSQFTVLLGSDGAEQLTAHLDRYLIREDVELATRPLHDVTIAVQSVGVPLPAIGPEVRATWAPHASVVGGSRLTSEEFEQLRIRLGVPLDGIDIDQRNLPQEVDRNDQAISFTKGCYLGQEPVARIDALGRVNWLLRRLEIEGPPPERETELTIDGQAVGRVTSAVATKEGSLALAYVRREYTTGNALLVCAGSAARVC